MNNDTIDKIEEFGLDVDWIKEYRKIMEKEFSKSREVLIKKKEKNDDIIS